MEGKDIVDRLSCLNLAISDAIDYNDNITDIEKAIDENVKAIDAVCDISWILDNGNFEWGFDYDDNYMGDIMCEVQVIIDEHSFKIKKMVRGMKF